MIFIQCWPGEPCLMVLDCFSVLRVSVFLLQTEGVPAVASLFLVGSSWSDSLMKDELFVSICPSADSDIISRISESAKLAYFKASMLSRKLAIMCFWCQKLKEDVRPKTREVGDSKKNRKINNKWLSDGIEFVI